MELSTIVQFINIGLNLAVLGGVITLTRSYSRVELKVDTIWDWFVNRPNKHRDT